MALESVTHISDARDYRSMQVGDRAKMPRERSWAGENQQLFWEVQDYCSTAEGRPQFEVETIHAPGKELEYWLKRIR